MAAGGDIGVGPHFASKSQINFNCPQIEAIHPNFRLMSSLGMDTDARHGTKLIDKAQLTYGPRDGLHRSALSVAISTRCIGSVAHRGDGSS